MQGGGCDLCKFTYLLASGNGGMCGLCRPKNDMFFAHISALKKPTARRNLLLSTALSKPKIFI